MERDDTPVGRLLSRREALIALGAAMLGRASGARAQDQPVCVARPRQMEGPFFLDTGLNRSDIRSDPKTGAISPVGLQSG